MSDNEPAEPEEGDRAARATWVVVGVLALVVIVLGVWWLAARDDGSEVESVSDPDTTTETTGTTEAPSSTTTTDESGGSTTTLADEAGDGISVPEGAATTPVSVPRPAIEPTGIVGVRTARHEGYDRVVFEFDGELPGYDVRYADGPVTEPGRGDEVAVDGARVVTVLMDPASTVRFTATGYEELYTGPDRIPGGGATVTEVVEVGDFEAQAVWAVGLADEVDFAVSTLGSPSRLVIDFVNH